MYYFGYVTLVTVAFLNSMIIFNKIEELKKMMKVSI